MSYDLSMGSGIEEDEPNILESAYGLAAGTLIAGVKDIGDSLGTIGETIGFTSSYEASDTRDVIRNYAGETAAQFYDRNPNLVEGAGLLAGSVVGGLGGIKVLRAGMAMKESRLGYYLNLPHSSLEASRKAAIAVNQTSDIVYGALKTKTLKALGAGVGANALDTAAFEVAAMSLTFASPVYSEFEAGDYAKWIATNMLLGTGVGTVLSGIKTSYQIGTATNVAAKQTNAIRTFGEVGAASQEASFNLSALYKAINPLELERVKNISIASGAPEELAAAAINTRQAAAKTQISREMGRVIPDAELAVSFTKMLDGATAGTPVDAVSIVAGMQSAKRGMLEAGEKGSTFDLVTGKRYNAGEVPGTHLGDSLEAGTTVRMQGGKVVAVPARGDLKELTAKEGTGFTAMNEVEAQAAQIAAHSVGVRIEMKIAADDIPRMERLLEVPDDVLAKTPAVIGGKVFRTTRDIADALFGEKFRQAELLGTKLLPEQIATRLNVSPSFLQSAERTPSILIAKRGEELRNFLQAPRFISVKYKLPELTDNTAHLFIAHRAVEGTSSASISASAFLNSARMTHLKGEVPSKTVNIIAKKLTAGKKFAAPTITVAKSGSLTFDGFKRVTAVKKLLNELDETAGVKTGSYDNVPIRVVIEKGAKLPKELPSGEAFPVIIKADGTVSINPLADDVPAQLTKAYHQEEAYIFNANKQHSELRNVKSVELLPATSAMAPESLLLEILQDTSTPLASTQSAFKFTDSAMGSIGGATQLLGVQTKAAIQAVHDLTLAKLNPHIIAAKNDPAFKTGSELIRIDNMLKGTQDSYVLVRGATPGIQRIDVAINGAKAAKKAEVEAAWDSISSTRAVTSVESKAFRRELDSLSTIHSPRDAAAKEFIPMSDESFRLLEASSDINATNLASHSQVSDALGNASITEAQQFGLVRVYMPAVDTKVFKHFVLVRQADSITQTSHTSVVTAVSEQALSDKVKLIQREFPGMELLADPKKNYTFLYKSDIADYHKALGDYEYSRGMNDSAIDSALASKKVMWQPDEALPIDKQHSDYFLDNLVNWHRRMDTKRVRDVVEMRYAQLFRQLEMMGNSYIKAGTSQFGGASASAASFAASTVHNPYGDIVKQALDIGKQQEYPMFTAANEYLNKGYAKVVLNLKKGWLAVQEAKTPRDLDAEVANLNKIAETQGFGNPYQRVMLEKWRDQLAATPLLSNHIAKSNAVLNFLVLGSDMLQAFNTLIGTTVHATEIVALRKAILSHDASAAGKLAGLPKEDINLVEIAGRSAKAFWAGDDVFNYTTRQMEKQTGKQLVEGYVKETGLRSGDAKALMDAIDSAASGSANAATMGETADKLMEFGRRWSGNNTADLVSRFMAAHSMRIVTDKAASRGLISSSAEAAIYIHQHTTRVHGAAIASQRPVMFSGPIGQSIGVFMTFYVNFLQRMFQHIGEGNAPALATMAVMQVGLYGLQGLPAFNYINTHIIGTASGNRKHEDIYTAAGGSEEAKWIMFGAGSNLLGLIHPDLRVNLYSRGDLNPRQESIIPITPSQTALYTATAKTVENIAKLATHISGGAGIAPSLFYALEHNGVSRPISGLGALLSGGQSTSKGTMLAEYGNNDYSFFAIAARLAGGKPLDDANAADALFRSQAYKADRAARINKVGENMRVAMKNGGEIDTLDFMRNYTRAGGDLDNFNAYMKKQFAVANNSQIRKVASDMNTPEAAGLSRLLAGDFVEGEE